MEKPLSRSYEYKVNTELKKFLARHGITYRQIADRANYCKGTIDQWMRKELDENQKRIIHSAIKEIMAESGKIYAIPGSDEM